MMYLRITTKNTGKLVSNWFLKETYKTFTIAFASSCPLWATRWVFEPHEGGLDPCKPSDGGTTNSQAASKTGKLLKHSTQNKLKIHYVALHFGQSINHQ